MNYKLNLQNKSPKLHKYYNKTRKNIIARLKI